MEQSQRLRERFIDAVQDASEFESVAGLYNHIVRQGHRAFTPCPCHTDTTPSLSIDQDAQVGRCWLCLAQGDVFWLVMTHEDLCYRDAVHFLADRAGIKEPAGVTWTANQLRRPRATTEPDSRRLVLSLRSFQSPRRLRI